MRSAFVRYISIVLALALFGTAVYSSWATLRAAFTAYRSFESGHDDVSIWSARMAELKADLPAAENVIGYLTEIDLPGVAFDPIDNDEEFVMTQYDLAPFILEHGAGREYVVGNFGDPAISISAVEQQYNLELIKDYSMGIYLFKRAKP